jgi:hypothetical protein
MRRWPASSTPQGFTYFASSTVGKRGKGAADLRPYALLSGWAGFVPGVNTTDFTTVEGRPPLYGANNLAEPWTNPQIELIQAAFNPLLAADLPYWNASGPSDSSGDFPILADEPSLPYGQPVTRTITVFNDTLSGTSVQFSWSAHTGSATGPLIGSGSTTLTVPLAGRAQTPISFTAPSSGSSVYLTLQTAKNGVTIFSDSHETFSLGSGTTIVGGASGRCMDAYGQGTANGTVVDIWDCNGQANQQWTVNTNGTITGTQSGLCLDVSNAATANGTALQLYTCNGGTNQEWR